MCTVSINSNLDLAVQIPMYIYKVQAIYNCLLCCKSLTDDQSKLQKVTLKPNAKSGNISQFQANINGNRHWSF